MTEKRDRWNAVCTAVIFASFAVGVIQALFVFAEVFAGMTRLWTVVMYGSGVQIQSFDWDAIATRLAIFGACVVAFLAAGYGARRTTMPAR